MIKNKTNKLKIAICSILMYILLFICLLIFDAGMPLISEKLEAINPKKTGDMDNTLWLIRHIMYAFPISLCLIAQTVAGKIRKAEKYIVHREKLFENLFTVAFAFIVLLPYCVILTGVTENTDAVTYESIVWFVWQAMPLCLALFYQKLRTDDLKNAVGKINNEELNSEQ